MVDASATRQAGGTGDVPEGRIGFRRAVLVLGVLSWLGPFSLDAYTPAFPAIADDYRTDAAAVQLTLTALVVGLAVGQLVCGALTDAYGRRRPLLWSLVAYALATAGCAIAPDVWTLTAARFAQGATVAMAMVVGRAAARDLFEGRTLARCYSAISAVTAIAPAVGPLVGSQLLLAGSWRWIFVAVTGMAVGALVLSALLLPETAPPRERVRAGAQLRESLAAFGGLLRSAGFRRTALTLGLSSAVGLTYVAGAPFLLQEGFGLTPSQFGLVFVGNALTLVVAATISSRLSGRVGPRAVARAGLALQLPATVLSPVLVLAHVPVGFVLGALAAMVLAHGLVQPNLLTLGMQSEPDRAGSASALLGIAQFVLGGIAAPLIATLGIDIGVAMTGGMVALCAAACLAAVRLPGARGRRNGRVAVPILPGHGPTVH
ncbi:multidrug effflux MFS transporter [Pseudonocardia sp. RS010]|uniref:multidrug effflux MFS transporter n=1 Tax=Pseudonocardia sp. RS010 TaxID=3385979 RepID=UPI00399FF811